MIQKFLISLIFITFSLQNFGQTSEKIQLLYDLSKLHANGNTFKNPDSTIIQNLRNHKLYNENQFLIEFVIESTLPNNAILSYRFLKKPDTGTLNDLFAIFQISILFDSYMKDKKIKILETNINREINDYVLLENFYLMCFNNLGNIYSPLNLSEIAKIDLNLDSLGLVNNTEKAIFFFHYTEWCYRWISVAYKEDFKNKELFKNSYEYLKNYPTINGKKYFYYNNFEIEEFPLKFDNISFKEYYLQLYGQLLKTHLRCCEFFQDQKTYKEIIDSSIINVPQYQNYLENIIVPDTIIINF